MAWLWWLLAPLAITVLGVLMIGARARHEGRRGGAGLDAMTQHRRLVQALTALNPPAETPVTMLVLDPDHKKSAS